MIVVTTPTGTIGRQLLDRLVGSDEPIRAIARDASRIPHRVRDRIEVVEGSSDDPDVVNQAFDGADAVFWLVPPNFTLEDAESYYLDFSRPACAAITHHGVQRVVGVTSLGRDYGEDAGLLSAAFAMDRLIESTGVHYRALRMPYFMENLLSQADAIREQGTLSMANSGDRQLATVATRDIAAMACDLLLDRSWTGQDGVAVVGPDDLTPHEMAAVVSEVLARPVRLRETSGSELRATLVGYGASEGFAEATVDMVAAQDDGIYDAEHRASRRSPSGFRQWCEDVLAPAVPAR